ncbi:MAG TPA: hypothetical protein VIQ27_08050 [Gemmatimonadales bacterium]
MKGEGLSCAGLYRDIGPPALPGITGGGRKADREIRQLSNNRQITDRERRMTETVDMSGDSERAVEIRNALTDKLRADGMITSEVVERAFRTDVDTFAAALSVVSLPLRSHRGFPMLRSTSLTTR